MRICMLYYINKSNLSIIWKNTKALFMWSKRHAGKREMFECLNCFKWALQVLTIEQNLSYKKKLENQKIYATMIAEKNSESGRKVMMVRWRQSEEERAEYLTQKLWIQDQIRHMEDAGSVCYE